MKFKCPKCGKGLNVKDEMAGRKGRCPACKSQVVVPNAETASTNEEVVETPAEDIPEPPPMPVANHEFTLVQIHKKKFEWKAAVFDEHLTFFCGETNDFFKIMHEKAGEMISILHLFGPPTMILKIGGKKRNFNLDQNQYEAIANWIGKPVLLKNILKQRLGYSLPIGILYIVTSIPFWGDSQWYTQMTALNMINLFLGVSLIILAVVVKIKPGRSLFLADSLWFLLLAGVVAWDIRSGASVYWGILVAILVLNVFSGIKNFKTFAPEQA